MRSIPVDLSQLNYIMVTSAPEVRADLNTGEVRTDRTTGKPLFLVGVLVKVEGERRAYVLDVQVPGEPVGIVEGTFVTVGKMEAVPWERDGRSGVVYRVNELHPAASGAAGIATPAATATAAASAELAESASSAAGSSGRAGRGGGSS